MKKNMKAIFLFTTLLILLIGVGCAAAADLDDNSHAADTVEQTGTADTSSIDNKIVNKVNKQEVASTTKAATKDYTVTEKTYSKYFDNNAVAKNSVISNNSKLILSGNFKNKDFIFDNIKLTVTSKQNSVLYNTSIVAQNGAQVVLDGLTIKNTNKNKEAIIFESNGNTINNSEIEIVDNKAMHAIDVTGNKTTIKGSFFNITMPSADVEYDANWVGHPVSSGIFVSSNDNLIYDTVLYMDASEKTGYYPSADGIDIQSPDTSITINNNVVRGAVVVVNGPSYVYGINVGRAKNTKLEDVTVGAQSNYYADAIQLFDANTISISGDLDSEATIEAYGIYSTAMGSGISQNIKLNDLDITVNATKATGALIEGSSDVTISDSEFEITGDTATAVDAHVDWMGNVPKNILIEDSEMNIDGTADNSVLYFGLCENVTVTNNMIESTKGSEIYFNNTSKGSVTNNLIGIADSIYGDNAVKTTESDTVVKNNSGIYKLTNKNYSRFFDNDSVIKAGAVTNGSLLTAYGKFTNKDFIFDNVQLTFEGDENSVFYNTSIITQNNAKVTVTDVTIDNKNTNTYAILFESKGNTLKDSIITVKDNKAIHAVELSGDNNVLDGDYLYITMPSADVEYDANYVGHPVTSALFISSDNNLVEDTTIYLDASKKTGSYPSADAIDIQSPNGSVVINNNKIKNTYVNVKGPSYVYGINVGRAKNTKIEDIEVVANSKYYADAVQLFDANTIKITGKLSSNATSEAYGVYSTAMGVGASKNIDLTGLDMIVSSEKATGVLIEGSSNITIAKSNYDISGKSTTAVKSHVDWMGNVPTKFIIKNNNFTLKGTDNNNNVLYFGKASDVTVTKNNITSKKGSEININSTKKAKITDNYIVIGSDIFGDNAVITTESDTVVKNNMPYVTKVKFTKIANVPYANNVTISGILTSASGKNLENTNLQLTLNNKTVNIKTAKGGKFTYTTKATTMGTNNVTVSYKGNSNYGKVTAKTTFKVVKQNLTVKINKISSVVYKNNVTVSGTFADANGRGIANTLLQVKINGKSVNVKTGSGGKFTYTTKATTVGTNNVTVSYNGNTNYNKVSKKTAFKVTKQSLNVKINPIKTVVYKDNVTISGKLTDGNGKVIMNTLLKVKINGKTFNAKTNDKGIYTLTTKATTSGKNNVTVSYAGNANYNKVSAKSTFTVTKKAVVSYINNVKKSNGKITVTGKFTDSDKKVLMNSLVKVTINGKSANAKTNDKGVFTYTTNAPSGTIKLTVGYAGNDNYKSYTSPTLSLTV